ncbi:MAG: winged helix-turn-helix domain-containing protein [Methanoregula sp.]|jgi:DNA-binding transcriptional ArsR family regulator
MSEKVMVLEPGDEQARKIAKAMGNPTAGEILSFLSAGQKSLSEIAEHLAQPITTVRYHTENLLDAGLIVISETKYSVKGREVRMYSLTDRLLIVAPKQSSIRSLIVKYASLFVIVAAGSLAISLISPLLDNRSPEFLPLMTGASREAGTGAVMSSKVAQNAVWGGPAVTPNFAFAFFCGGALVILVLLCYEAYLWKKLRWQKNKP